MSKIDNKAEALAEINRSLKLLYKMHATQSYELKEIDREITRLESLRGIAILELADAAQEYKV